MAIVVTRNWEADRLSKKEPWSAHLEFQVSGTDDLSTALSASDPSTGVHVYQADESFSAEFPNLICTGPQCVKRKSLNYWIIGCDFETLSESAAMNPNPLLEPTTVRWETVLVTEQVDTDLDGHVISNSAGDPQQLSREIAYKRLHIWRNEPLYDVAKSESYELATNSVAMSIFGVSIKAEHCRCVSIQPAHDFMYVPNAIRYVRMYYMLEIVLHDQLGARPFQHRILDQGEWGWWSDGGTKKRAKFTGADNTDNPVSGVIRLDGTGLPLAALYSSIKVGNNHTPVTPPSGSQEIAIETDAGGKAKWLYYRKSRSVDLRALGL